MNARPATAADYRPDVAPVPVPVHVASVAPDAGQLAAAAPTCRTVYRTVTLTADDQSQAIMGASDKREIAWVVAIEADIYISDNESDAAAGTGAYVPCVTPSSSAPSLSAPYPVKDYRPVYVAAAVALTGSDVIHVSVSAVYRE